MFCLNLVGAGHAEVHLHMAPPLSSPVKRVVPLPYRTPFLFLRPDSSGRLRGAENMLSRSTARFVTPRLRKRPLFMAPGSCPAEVFFFIHASVTA